VSLSLSDSQITAGFHGDPADQNQDYDQEYDDEAGWAMVVKEPMFRPSNVDEMDMKLLWFYTSTTSNSFSIENGFGRPVQDIMRSTLVQLAFENPFLMDSLFALASIHMQATNQIMDNGRGTYYRAKAVQSYRRAIEESKPKTFPALLSASLIFTALTSEIFRDRYSQDLFILDWITIWRGIGIMVDLTTVAGMFRAGIDPLFYRPVMDLEAATAAIPNELLFMISSIPADDPDYLNVQTYYTTLKFLGSLYQNLPDDFGPLMHLRVITWLTFLNEKFIKLARQKQPRALIILAHYACFLKIARDVWWIKDIGQRTLTDICNYLGPEWHPNLRVPLQASKIEDHVQLGRHILGDPSWVPVFPTDAWGTFHESGKRRVAWVDNNGKTVKPPLLVPSQESGGEVRMAEVCKPDGTSLATSNVG
jgi:hypothetical protein